MRASSSSAARSSRAGRSAGVTEPGLTKAPRPAPAPATGRTRVRGRVRTARGRVPASDRTPARGQAAHGLVARAATARQQGPVRVETARLAVLAWRSARPAARAPGLPSVRQAVASARVAGRRCRSSLLRRAVVARRVSKAWGAGRPDAHRRARGRAVQHQLQHGVPRIVRSPRLEKLCLEKARARGWTYQQVHDEYREDMALRRLTEPQDVANALVFLASADSRNITGQELVVDGGWDL